MTKYGVEFKAFKGRRKIGSSYYELSKGQYDELKDVVKNEI